MSKFSSKYKERIESIQSSDFRREQKIRLEKEKLEKKKTKSKNNNKTNERK